MGEYFHVGVEDGLTHPVKAFACVSGSLPLPQRFRVALRESDKNVEPGSIPHQFGARPRRFPQPKLLISRSFDMSVIQVGLVDTAGKIDVELMQKEPGVRLEIRRATVYKSSLLQSLGPPVKVCRINVKNAPILFLTDAMDPGARGFQGLTNPRDLQESRGQTRVWAEPVI